MSSRQNSSRGFEQLEDRSMMAILISPQIVPQQQSQQEQVQQSQQQVQQQQSQQQITTEVLSNIRYLLQDTSYSALLDRPDLELNEVNVPDSPDGSNSSSVEQLAQIDQLLASLGTVSQELQQQRGAIQSEIVILDHQRTVISEFGERLGDLYAMAPANTNVLAATLRLAGPIIVRLRDRLPEIEADIGVLALEAEQIEQELVLADNNTIQAQARRNQVIEQIQTEAIAAFEADFEVPDLPEYLQRIIELDHNSQSFRLPTNGAISLSGAVDYEERVNSAPGFGLSVSYGSADRSRSNGVHVWGNPSQTYMSHQVNGRSVATDQEVGTGFVGITIQPDGFVSTRLSQGGHSYRVNNAVSDSVLTINHESGTPYRGIIGYVPDNVVSRSDVWIAQADILMTRFIDATQNQQQSSYYCYQECKLLQQEVLELLAEQEAAISATPASMQQALRQHLTAVIDQTHALQQVIEGSMQPALEALYQETTRPSISVVSTDPRRVVFHVLNPGEGSQVQLQPVSRFNQPQGMWGELAVRDFDHAGGTSHLIDMVAANAALNTDGYNLLLLDEQGAVLDSVFIPAVNGNMTGADPQDMWDAHQYVEQCDILSTPEAAAMLNMAEPMPAMDGDIFMRAEEQMMDQVATGELYNGAVPSLPSVLRASREMLHNTSGLVITDQQKIDAMYAMYPALSDPALMQAEYDAMIASRPTFSAGSSIEKVNDYYRWITNQFSEAHIRYNEHMKNVVLPAANTVMQLAAQGQDTAAARQTLRDALGQLGSLQANLLQGQVPFAVPGEQQILEIGCDLYFSQTEMFRHFVETEEDVLQRMQNAYNRQAERAEYAEDMGWNLEAGRVLNDIEIVDRIRNAAINSASFTVNGRAEATIDAVREQINVVPISDSYQQVLSWFSASSAANTADVRDDTTVGRIYQGMMYQFSQAESAAERTEIAVQVERITAIPASKILENITSDGNVSSIGMRSLFEQAGYSSIFLDSDAAIQAPTGITAVNVAEVGSNIRIRLDVINHAAIQRIRVLHPVSGNLLAASRNQTFVNIPVELLNMSIETSFDVEVVFANGNRISTRTEPFQVTGSGIDNGDDPITNERLAVDDVENAILQSARFPLDTSRPWYNLLGSGRHTDAGSSLHAVDLNYGDIGEDRNAPIYAAADGVVQRIYRTDTNVTIIVLDHELADGDKWSTVYMHQPMTENDDADENGNNTWTTHTYDGTEIVSLRIGDTVMQGQQIAAVGHEGAGTADHLHFEVHVGAWRSSQAINLDMYLNHYSFNSQILLANKGLYAVDFDNNLNEWVNYGERVVVDQQSDGSYIMRAWESNKTITQMQAIEWKKVHVENEPLPEFKWVSINDNSKIWDYSIQSFISVTLINI